LHGFTASTRYWRKETHLYRISAFRDEVDGNRCVTMITTGLMIPEAGQIIDSLPQTLAAENKIARKTGFALINHL
jgi:hypothetical protein